MKLTTIANATVIGALQPIVVAIAATGSSARSSGRDMALGLVAIAGVVIVVLSAASDAPTDWRGDLLAVGALFAWSAYFVFAKRAKDVITTNDYTVGAALWVAIINARLHCSSAEPRLAHARKLGLAATDGVRCRRTGPCGHELVAPTDPAVAREHLHPARAGRLDPVAWAFLDEPVTGVQVGAIVLVLVALTGVITGPGGYRPRPRPLRR